MLKYQTPDVTKDVAFSIKVYLTEFIRKLN